MTVEVEQTDEFILDPRAIAKQFVADAIANLNVIRQRDHEEWLADQALAKRMEHSQWCRLGWVNRKKRLAGATSPTDAPDGIE